MPAFRRATPRSVRFGGDRPASIRRAAERITRFTAGKTYDDYLGDDMFRAAVERQFAIIGEAFVGLRRVDPSLAAQLPDLPQIIAPTLTLPRLRGREGRGSTAMQRSITRSSGTLFETTCHGS